MKRYIRAMAVPRKEATSKLNSYADVIQRHVIECVVYKDSLGYLHYWIGELAIWMNTANKVVCKSPLKESDYVDYLFGTFGDDRNDAEVDLQAYQKSDLRTDCYPDFEVTDELIDELFATTQKLIEVAVPILASGVRYPVIEWIHILKNRVFIF